MTMTTELMEVYALEVGDTIVHEGELFVITALNDEALPDSSITEIICSDEEGYRRSIMAWDFDKIRIVCDTDHIAEA